MTVFSRTIPTLSRSARLRALLGTACVLLPLPLLAQEVADPYDLGTVRYEQEGQGAIGPDNTIVATRTATGSRTDTALIDLPAAVSVVTEAELERRDVEDTTQALSYTSSVTTDEYGSDDRYDYFRIRGFYQTGEGLYRDGLPSRTLNFTGPKLEPFGLQRIEVLKGSTSTLFGLNAPGGLVNAITKRPQDQAFGESTMAVGPDHQEFGLDFGRPIDAAGKWTYRVTALAQDGSNDGDHTRDDRLYFAPALTWRPSDATRVTFLAHYYERDGNAPHSTPVGVDIDPDTFLAEPDFNRTDREEASLGWDLAHRVAPGLTFSQVARYTSLDLDLEQVYGGGATAATPRSAYYVDGTLESFAINSQLQYDATLRGVGTRTLAGVDYARDELSEVSAFGSIAGIDPFDPEYCGRACVLASLGTPTELETTQETTGVFLQEELTFADRWIVTLGTRYDTVSTETGAPGATASFEDEAVTSRAGLTYKATADLSLYANYSESFQPVGSYFRSLVTDVEPQEGTQYELGAKYRPGGGNALFTAAVFDLTQTNLVRQLSPLAYSQIGEVRVRGAELDGKWAIGNLSLTASYAYWDAEITENGLGGNEGNRPYNTPEHIASLWADYTVAGQGARGDLNLGGGLRHTGPSFADDANTTELGGITVVDAAVSYELSDNVALALNVSNLFDEREVIYSYDANWYNDGRQVRARLTYTW
ncbi:TonB-dependent siderophore receptor [Rubellimicrobium aerolatum]|uniref:TonB-dependent siderophore receptor n=1 Tax=Rubellimicrobium aerolatum TaxID=490979 RepID=A0ABW0S9Z2_9RHOB|nr:TonB-dependent siderophore receptor [Rubellimicrobium aerolatum]MBP1805107.1 iron complex outermembrane receptor protein [Rubellimicrobium aerolatum]